MDISNYCVWCGHENNSSSGDEIASLRDEVTALRARAENERMREREMILSGQLTKSEIDMLIKKARERLKKSQTESDNINDRINKCKANVGNIVYLTKCNYCGEELRPKMMNDNELTIYAQKLYEIFKGFIEDEYANIPEAIDIRLDRNIGDASCDYDESTKKFFVEFNPHNQIFRHNLAPMLYHEYTHISQMYEPSSGGKKKDKKLFWLEEYQASAVQMKRMLGYKTINEAKNISIFNTVIYDGRIIMVKHYFDCHLKKLINRIERECKHITITSIYSMVFAIMYHLGEVSVFKNIDKNLLKPVSNIDKLISIIENKITLNDDESPKSFKILEDYLIYSPKDIDGYVLYDMINEIGNWIIEHIPEQGQ